jgi:AraC family transcriptional regulator
MRENDVNPVAKALWFIESHFATEVTLADIADVAGVSRFHMVRTFGMTTGHSVMRYVRGRRLSEAARALAKGAPDILMVALDAGYGSHEAFTRAFRDQFGLTPDMVRATGTVDNLLLVEPVTMDETSNTKLAEPALQDGRALLIAGLGERYAFENLGGLPALWRRFGEHLGHVPGQVGQIA